jgi:hypothetical protein
MNSTQIKEILRRERAADSLVFVSEKSPEFFFQGGRLKFPLFEWPASKGFTFAIWFKSSFQLLLKGGEDRYQLSASETSLCFNGSSYNIDVKDWVFLYLVHTPQKVKICLNGVMMPDVASPYPKTRQWDDCSLGSNVGVADFMIFKEALKDHELSLLKSDLKSNYLVPTLTLNDSVLLYLSASQVDDSESICYDSSSNLHHAALEGVKVIKKINLMKVYDNLNFPISLLTLLPKTIDAYDDVNTRVKTFFSVLTDFLITDKDRYFQKFIDSKGHELMAEIIRNENLAESGLILLNAILNLRSVMLKTLKIRFLITPFKKQQINI